jgi:hypothetical protein
VPRKLLGSISSPLVMRNLRAAEAQCIAVGGGWGKHSNENRPQVNERGCAQYIEVQSRSSELLCYRQPKRFSVNRCSSEPFHSSAHVTGVVAPEVQQKRAGEAERARQGVHDKILQ